MFARLGFLASAALVIVAGQTTQGLLSGRLLDSRTGIPIPNAHVACGQEATGTRANALSDDEGFYALPLLPPGSYSVRVTAGGYQAQEAQEIELAVAGRVELHFLLRPLADVWEAGLYRSVFLPGSQTVVTFYGPDVDASYSSNFENSHSQQSTLESTVSEVIHPSVVDRLPLAGRDVYSLLFTLPAVTSDGGVSRGLGLSVNGQRPSSSNYLLDGVENNNYLITGPLTPIAPEAIEEYRVSISSYSAQYGRTAGFIANAVTRSGTAEWHGVGYFYFRNAVLDANTFQRNLAGLGRPLDRGLRPGFQVGGPLLRNRLYVSGAFERFSGRQRQDPQTFWLPTPAMVAALPDDSVAAKLLTQYPTPLQTLSTAPCTLAAPAGCYASTLLAPPISINQSVGLLRLDYVPPGGKHHLLSRVAVTRMSRPDFLWSPYKPFTTGYDQTDVASLVGHQWAITPRLTNEIRAAYSFDEIGWGSVQNQVPTLNVVLRTPQGSVQLDLPGSSPVYPYQNNSGSIELLDNLVWTRGRHVITIGAGLLLRHLDGFYAPKGNGIYTFGNFRRFWNGTPDQFATAIDRSDLSNPSTPDYNSQYVNRQYSLFAQESFRLTPRLLLNYGLRYESFGAPHSVGSNRNAVVVPGPGSNIQEQLETASLDFSGGPSGLLYRPDHSDIAIRFGFSYNPWGRGNTLLHGAYGIFYDRPFDNLWETVRTNNLNFAQITFGGAPVDYSQPAAQALPGYASQYSTTLTSVPNLTLFQQNLRNGYAQDVFAGIQQRATRSLLVDINGMASLGRSLITNDTLGYGTPVDRSQEGIPAGQLFTYRGNQGQSDYYALAIQARYQRGRSLFQAAYTWSHAIDNQSDPLGLDLSNFGFSSPGLLPAVPTQLVAGFAQPMDSRGDRGNADFDERHNLVLQAAFDLPAGGKGWLRSISRDWTIAGVAAVRSGFPYTVYALGGLKGFTRANIVDPSLTLAHGEAAPGGKYLLNAAGFSGPGGPGQPSGRNAFIGPGMRNLDLAVSRAFRVRGLPETSRLILRADIFNVLNHANLNNPYPVLGDGFGLATFGRVGFPTGFPTPVPLAETPRQMELSLHLRF